MNRTSSGNEDGATELNIELEPEPEKETQNTSQEGRHTVTIISIIYIKCMTLTGQVLGRWINKALNDHFMEAYIGFVIDNKAHIAIVFLLSQYVNCAVQDELQ